MRVFALSYGELDTANVQGAVGGGLTRFDLRTGRRALPVAR